MSDAIVIGVDPNGLVAAELRRELPDFIRMGPLPMRRFADEWFEGDGA